MSQVPGFLVRVALWAFICLVFWLAAELSLSDATNLSTIAPAMLFFIGFYEERELEVRFGPSYLEYQARTPMLLPRRPGSRKARVGAGTQ